ncbi:MAG TPA: hypothetical protein V6D20_10790 [Candidatus Obscuribacterales bacterium]
MSDRSSAGAIAARHRGLSDRLKAFHSNALPAATWHNPEPLESDRRSRSRLFPSPYQHIDKRRASPLGEKP